MVVLLCLFSVAAILGLALATQRLRERPRWKSVALVHGGLATASLIALIVLCTGAAGTILAVVALAMFIVGAVLGFGLLAFAILKHEQPIPLMVIHGMATVSGIGLLVAAVMGMG